jgi:hypothetical protein
MRPIRCLRRVYIYTANFLPPSLVLVEDRPGPGAPCCRDEKKSGGHCHVRLRAVALSLLLALLYCDAPSLVLDVAPEISISLLPAWCWLMRGAVLSALSSRLCNVRPKPGACGGACVSRCTDHLYAFTSVAMCAPSLVLREEQGAPSLTLAAAPGRMLRDWCSMLRPPRCRGPRAPTSRPRRRSKPGACCCAGRRSKPRACCCAKQPNFSSTVAASYRTDRAVLQPQRKDCLAAPRVLHPV